MQYLLAILLLVIMVPILMLAMSYVLRDNIGLYCIPFLIANLIFGFIMVFAALYVLVYTILFTSN